MVTEKDIIEMEKKLAAMKAELAGASGKSAITEEKPSVEKPKPVIDKSGAKSVLDRFYEARVEEMKKTGSNKFFDY